MKRFSILTLLLSLFLVTLPVHADEQEAPVYDHASLAGLTTGKAIFDIRTREPGRLLFTLKVIKKTAESMRAQDVVPDFVLSFRGGTLPLLKVTPDTANDAELAMLEEIHERLAVYKEEGMVLEACHVAADIFKIGAGDLDTNIALVGNSLISLTGYQNKGYALVPMY